MSRRPARSSRVPAGRRWPIEARQLLRDRESCREDDQITVRERIPRDALRSEPDLLCVLAGLLLPLLLYRMVRSGKYREGCGEKFWGEAPLRIGDRPCLWFHAVSVGEVLLLRPLVREMARRRPDWEVVISTTTPTGLAVARRTFPDLVTFYAPLDFSWATRRAMARIRPTVLALVELELWPNLIRAAKRSGAKVAIINARLSPRSYRGYRSLRGPLGPTLRLHRRRGGPERGIRPAVRRAGRSRAIGSASPARSSTTAWRATGTTPGPASCGELLGLAPPTWSSWPAARWRARRPRRWRPTGRPGVSIRGLRLILVPRHAERFDEVAAWLEQNGRDGRPAEPVRRAPAAAGRGGPPPVILIDTIGELSAVWGLADVAFVGGSLCRAAAART